MMNGKMNKKQAMIALCMMALAIAPFAAGTQTRAGKLAQQPQVSPSQNDNSPVMVGVLRADGTLVPFAQYTNGTWWNPWTQPIRDGGSQQLIPKSLSYPKKPWFQQNGRIPSKWYFWAAADTPTVVKASEAVRTEIHTEVWGLMTDYPKGPVENINSHHHENLGVALTVSQKVNHMITLDPSSSEAKKLAWHIKLDFEQAERDEIARINREHKTDFGKQTIGILALTDEERGKVEVSITQLSRSEFRVNGAHFYYFAAKKEYKKPASSEDASCNDVSIHQGWMTRDTDSSGSGFEERFSLTDCDNKGGVHVSPFSIVTIDNRTFLFVEEHGWEDEGYTIFEFNESGLNRVLETPEG